MSTYIIISLAYQRNGMSGEGFFQVEFVLTEDGRSTALIAVMPDRYDEETEEHSVSPTHTYVINPSDKDSHWRGDRIGSLLCPWVEANRDAAFPSLYPETVSLFPAEVHG